MDERTGPASLRPHRLLVALVAASAVTLLGVVSWVVTHSGASSDEPSSTTAEDPATLHTGSYPTDDPLLVPGRWVVRTFRTGGVGSTSTTDLHTDGTFVQVVIGSGDPVRVAGTYTVVQPGTIEFRTDEHTTEWCLADGCVPVHVGEIQRLHYSFVDGYTMAVWTDDAPLHVFHVRSG